MLFNVYAIYDRVSGEYGQPTIALKDELAVRQFDYVMQASPMVASDCELYCIGSYDTSSGELLPTKKPVFVRKFEKAVQVNE